LPRPLEFRAKIGAIKMISRDIDSNWKDMRAFRFVLHYGNHLTMPIFYLFLICLRARVFDSASSSCFTAGGLLTKCVRTNASTTSAGNDCMAADDDQRAGEPCADDKATLGAGHTARDAVNAKERTGEVKRE